MSVQKRVETSLKTPFQGKPPDQFGALRKCGFSQPLEAILLAEQ